MYTKIILLIITHFVVPATFLVWLWKRRYQSKFDWLVMMLLVGSYTYYLFFTGDWYWFGYYLRYILVLGFAVAALKALIVSRHLPLWKRRNSREWFGVIFSLFFTVVFSGFAAWGYVGRFYSAAPTELQFPLRHGTFFIMQGGNSPLINHHHRPGSPLQYALDITRLYPGGLRAGGLYPSSLNAYAVFGDTVYAPCDARVAAVVDNLPDVLPAELDTSAASVAGNYVVLARDSVRIMLAQLEAGSILVKAGDFVESGQPLARVGNSGFSFEPHLHIHATRGGSNPIMEGRAVPMTFSGRFLVRNDRLDVP